MATQTQRLGWILDYLESHISADVVNQDFHEAYHARFPEYSRKETMFGAQPVAQAQRDLSRMEQSGIVERVRVTLGMQQVGFPAWVWSYRLPQD